MTKTTDFWVGDRLVRPSLGEIQLGLERVHLEPRSMEVLLALADRAPEVVPKQELIDAVWGEDFVTDDVLTHAIWDLRRAFGDQASDPEFIQTIPKRGYRLIAPVKPLEQPRRRATDRGLAPGPPERPARRRVLRRVLIWGPLLLAVLLLAFLRFGAGTPGGGPPEPLDRQRLLLALGYSDGPGSWGQRLESSLGRALAGADLEVLSADSCVDGSGRFAAYCLEARLLHLGDNYEVHGRLLRSGDGGLAYSATAPVRSDGEDLEAAAAELATRVRTYFEVIEDPFYDDPDVQPWFSLQDHDIRAVRDFLHGLAYVYRNEIGARHALAAAIELAPDFVAPRVFRTPNLVEEADPAILDEHRRELDRLYPQASGFEKAMIKWARALIDGDRAEQIQQLRIALGEAPGNRPIQYVLAMMLAEGGDLEEAWRLVEPLLGQGWEFPGLYSGAAEVAILRGRIDDIRRALDLALEVEPVDPDALAIMLLLAIYDDDPASQAGFHKRLQLRLGELADDDRRLGAPGVAERLAVRAESEGRAPIAARLREFAG